jgi:putative nucleotidyltransferase with HDIG domain
MEISSNLPKRFVPSGTYIASGRENESLEAYLGTCVGVTLCDRNANVGGLIHLLLPEPTGIDTPWHPENYATTGLPLFIQALCDLGASKEKLDACLAGGALVGPISEQDLSLDIGGRTAEAVERILDQERIPIGKSETGGCSGCCLALNLQTWESQIRPLARPTPIDGIGFQKPSAEQLEQAVHQVRPIPQIALKILRMIQDQTYAFQDLAREIRQDQIITARVIRLCNSVLFARRTRIDSIDRALVLIGERRLLQLVISASMESFFSQNERGYSLCKGGLYKHAVGAAIFTERLADFTGRVSTDLAYTAGLLHDIGKVVLDQYMTSAYPFFYCRTQLDGANLVSVEREAFGVSHTEIGGRLAASWSLHESLIDTVCWHHEPEQATVNPELTHLVYLTDLLMSRFLMGQELERLNTDRLTARLERVGLTISQLPILVDLIPRTVFEVSAPN